MKSRGNGFSPPQNNCLTPMLQRKWLALLSRLSYVGILKRLAGAAYAFGVGNRVRLGEEDLMMPAGLNRFAC